jgi:hypothetical protein
MTPKNSLSIAKLATNGNGTSRFQNMHTADKVMPSMALQLTHFLPPDCRRKVVWEEDGELRTSGSARLRSTLPISPRSFQESVQQLPPEQAWAVEYLVDSGNIEAILALQPVL